jgi:hypothetical protein
MKKFFWSAMFYRVMAPVMILMAGYSCSHSYEGDNLDLGFYQWNLWADTLANPESPSALISEGGEQKVGLHEPGCGWEEFNRGIGQLVRIPAQMGDYLSQEQEGEAKAGSYRGVAWYHCRFTLPKTWADQPMTLVFGGAGPKVEVYLNETLVGVHQGSDAPFSIDVTGTIYHVRDNHLAIRISDPEGIGGGITGEIRVKPQDKPGPDSTAKP